MNSTRYTIKPHQIFPIATVAISVILMLLIYPLKLIGKTTYTLDSINYITNPSAELTEGTQIHGQFSGNGNPLIGLGFMINTSAWRDYYGSHYDTPEEDDISPEEIPYIMLTVQDENTDLVWESQLPIAELINNSYNTFPVNFTPLLGEVYTYTLSTSNSSDRAPTICLGDFNSMPECYVNAWYNDNSSLPIWPLMQLTYESKLSLKKALPIFFCILAMLCLVLKTYQKGLEFRFKERCALFPDWIGRAFICFVLAFLFSGMLYLSDDSRIPIHLAGNELQETYGDKEYDYMGTSEDGSKIGPMAHTQEFSLKRGTYKIGVAYHADTDGNTLNLYDNGTLMLEFPLEYRQNYKEVSFTLDHDCPFFYVDFYFGGKGFYIINDFTIAPAGSNRFYTDSSFYILCVWLLAGGLFLLPIFWTRRGWNRQDKLSFLLLSATAIFALHPYMNGYLEWGDDICYHLIRIEGIKDGLLSGQVPVIIYPEALQGYGFLNCMYPSLFLYIPALLRIGGVSISCAFKTLIFLSHAATAFITYYSVKSVLKEFTASEKVYLPALTASILYTLSPYRFTNIYARAALGEALAMTFFPLLLAGLFHILMGQKKKWPMLVLGLTGLLQCHILSCLIGLLICLLLGCLCLGQVILEKRFVEIGKAALLTALLNVWFWFPFLWFYRSKILSTDSLNWSDYQEYSLLPFSLFGTFNSVDYRTYSLGIPLLILLLILGLWLYAEKKTASPNCYTLLQFSFVGALICTVMMIHLFPAHALMNLSFGSCKPFYWLLQNIQFPWRLLGPATCFLAFAGSIALFGSGKIPAPKTIAIILMVISAFSVTHYNYRGGEYYAYENFSDDYSLGHYQKLTGIPRAENTIVYPYEWQPQKASDILMNDATEPRFYNYGDRQPEILSYSRLGTTSTLTYTNATEGTLVSFPLLAYPGYIAVDETDSPLAIAEGDGALVQVAMDATPGTHSIRVTYRIPTSFTLAFALSLITLALWGICSILGKPILHLTGLLQRNRHEI